MVCRWFCEVFHWLACSSWTPGSAHVIAMHCTLTTHCDNSPAQVPKCKCSRVLRDSLADDGLFRDGSTGCGQSPNHLKRVTRKN